MNSAEVKNHFNKIAPKYDAYKSNNKFYYKNLKDIVCNLVPRNSKVMEVGCGTGDILVSTKPKYGYGVDISPEMIRIAKAKHANKNKIHFSTVYPNEKFEYIFMSDVVEHLAMPQSTFRVVSKHLKKDGVFINTMANPIWEPLLIFWEKMGWKMPEGDHNRISTDEVARIMESVGIKTVAVDNFLLMPVYIPFVTVVVNKYLSNYFKKYCFINCIVGVKT